MRKSMCPFAKIVFSIVVIIISFSDRFLFAVINYKNPLPGTIESTFGTISPAGREAADLQQDLFGKYFPTFYIRRKNNLKDRSDYRSAFVVYPSMAEVNGLNRLWHMDWNMLKNNS
jgi:hypothetical protein